MITYQEIRENEEVQAYLKKGNENLGVLGYTDHSAVHCTLVAEEAGRILRELGYSEHEISDILEIHEFRVKKALEKSRNYTDKKILSKLEELADLDYNIKSGNIDKDIGLELFILNM